MLAKTLVLDEYFDWQRMPPELNDIQFRQWSALLKSRLGMDLKPQRKQFLMSKLRMRMRKLGIADFQSYFDYVTNVRSGSAEWLQLVEHLTIHETRFRRHPSSFKLVSEYFLPRYCAGQESLTKIQAWSVGCATGEEAYTLAFTLAQFIDDNDLDVYYSVTATDISRESLAIAREACYSSSRLTNLDEKEVESYFDKVDGGYQVQDNFRRRVCFAQGNVSDLARAPVAKMDIIFCQNLLIYFEPDERQRIVRELVNFLKPGALLVLGIGEVVSWHHASLQRVEYEDTLAYQKVKD